MLSKYPRQLLLIGPPLLGIVLLAVYWVGLFGDFAFDDYTNIVDNVALRMGGDSLASMRSAASSSISSPMGRPISMISFALNYLFFGELPFSFKLTNLAIHYANALLIFLLAWQVSVSSVLNFRNEHARVLALSVATLWALHPMNAMPVLHVVQRMTSLSALFTLAGLSLYMYGRRAKTLPGYFAILASLLVCWPLAIYSKETGFLLPIYLVLYEWLLLRSFEMVPRNTIRWSFVLAGGFLLALCWAKWEWIVGGYRMRDFSLADRLYTQPRVLWFYIQQLLCPVPHWFGLYHDDIAVSRGLLSPSETLVAIVGWIAFATFAYSQRARKPLFAFAIFWFLASHLLESTVLPLEIAHEHRNYLASLGLFLWLANELLLNGSTRPSQWTGMFLLLGFILFCGYATSLRSSQWADDQTRKQAEVVNHPQSARANYEFAINVLNRTFDVGRGSPQDYELIHLHLQRAAALEPSGKTALLGVLYLDCAAGKSKNEIAFADLLGRFANAPFTHGDRSVIHSLSSMLAERKLCLDDGSVELLINAGLSNRSLDSALRGTLYAVAMDYAIVRMHSMPLALEFAQAAVASDASAVALRINLIHLYLSSGKVEEARQEYTRLLALAISARDKPGMDQLKNLVEAPEHNATMR
jgi:hypothetical protein